MTERKAGVAMDKLCSIREAIGSVPDGAMIALGGNTLNRAPMEAVLEIVRQGKKHLRLIKTAGGLDVDLLSLGECLDSVDAGFISMETEYGLAQHYRRAVQSGSVRANEHACYTVISALRAGASFSGSGKISYCAILSRAHQRMIVSPLRARSFNCCLYSRVICRGSTVISAACPPGFMAASVGLARLACSVWLIWLCARWIP